MEIEGKRKKRNKQNKQTKSFDTWFKGWSGDFDKFFLGLL